jgi:hypothetical protein
MKPALDGSTTAAIGMRDLGLDLGGRCMALGNIPLLLTTSIVLQHQFKSSQRHPGDIAARVFPTPMIEFALAAIVKVKTITCTRLLGNPRLLVTSHSKQKRHGSVNTHRDVLDRSDSPVVLS